MKKIRLSHEEASVLAIHMEMVKKPIKKAFWKQGLQGIKNVHRYEAVVKRIVSDTKKDGLLLSVNRDEYDVLSGFITWYGQHIRNGSKDEGLNSSQKETLFLLGSIEAKVMS